MPPRSKSSARRRTFRDVPATRGYAASQKGRDGAYSLQTTGNVWCGPGGWRCRVCGSEFPLAQWDGDRFRLWDDEHRRCGT